MTHNYLSEQSWKKLCQEACQDFNDYDEGGKKLQYSNIRSYVLVMWWP